MPIATPVLVMFDFVAEDSGAITASKGHVPSTPSRSPSSIRSGSAASDNFANPKSRIFRSPRFVTNRFAGLISRWTIPFW